MYFCCSHYLLSGAAEHGPSVDCLSVSPKAAVGNEPETEVDDTYIVLQYMSLKKMVEW